MISKAFHRTNRRWVRVISSRRMYLCSQPTCLLVSTLWWFETRAPMQTLTAQTRRSESTRNKTRIREVLHLLEAARANLRGTSLLKHARLSSPIKDSDSLVSTSLARFQIAVKMALRRKKISTIACNRHLGYDAKNL